MYSETPTERGSKGSVSIINSNGRLQLRFHYGGRRYYFSTGWADTPTSRKLAELKAEEVEEDILWERFDESLEKYKPKSSLSTVTPLTPIQKPKPELDQLWDKYSQFKKPQVSPSTFAKDFTKHRNHITKLPTRSLDEASAIRDHLLANLTPDAAKRCLTQLKACCNWAIEEGLIDINPFTPMKIKVPKGATEEQDIEPFSKEERDLIIRTFASDRYYSHYTNYVRFLFFTGCRPSEAIGLKWKHITNSVIQLRASVVVSENGLVLKEGLKTQTKRDFPINSELQAIVAEIRTQEPNSEAFVFTSPTGKFIDHHNFSNRAWKTILAKCGVPYRKSYQTRHTFISLCVESHINSTAISRWTGTSAKMIDNHYAATNFTNLRPPELI
ncbi:integrase [Nodularia spumigena CENA596]|uniref:Integrase n=1 Tax=Nodularia spumigena CENA596 TaxID=1819295 RepID=A0A161VCQ8_NODSP|nr:site-specific integrase [Nodularia spumigena]KZL51247.1 integrase [Nodularia spumigena CENA596]